MQTQLCNNLHCLEYQPRLPLGFAPTLPQPIPLIRSSGRTLIQKMTDFAQCGSKYDRLCPSPGSRNPPDAEFNQNSVSVGFKYDRLCPSPGIRNPPGAEFNQNSVSMGFKYDQADHSESQACAEKADQGDHLIGNPLHR